MGDDARFPFATRNATTRAAIDNALVEVTPLLRHLIRKIAGRRFSATDRDDVLQDLLVSVWQVLPRYDASKGVSLATYLYAVCRNALYSRLRKKPGPSVLSLNGDVSGGLERIDRRTELLARAVLASPGQYMTPRQVDVAQAILADPTATTARLGDVLKIDRRQVSKLRERMFRRVAKLADADELPMPTNCRTDA